MKHAVREDSPAVSLSHRIEKIIGQEEAGIDDEDSRHKSDRFSSDQKPAQDERSIFRKREPDTTEDEEGKETCIRKLCYRCGY